MQRVGGEWAAALEERLAERRAAFGKALEALEAASADLAACQAVLAWLHGFPTGR